MTQDKVQVLIELLKQGDGAKAAATDLKVVETQLGKTSDAANSLRSTLRNLFISISASVLIQEITQATVQTEQMHNVLRSVAGSSNAAAREFQFVRDEAQRLGLDFQRAVGSFASLSAAAKGTSLAGEGVKEIFKGINEASTVLGLSAPQTEGALQAIQQMISKGTVAAEELRGQLGERLPGAFNIAARAMGVTTQELGKMLEQGQVLSADFLPKFAAELRKTFAEDATKSAGSLTAEINRMKTAFFEFKAAVGSDASGLIRNALGLTTETLNFLREHKEAISVLATAIGIFVVEAKAAQLVMGTLTASNALFGAAWLKSGADVAAAASLIATSTVSMATTVTASLAGVTAGVWAIVEAMRALNAMSEESESKANLVAQTNSRRASIEKELALREQLGQITKAQADAARTQLETAFKVTQVTKPIITGGMSMANPGTVTTDEVDLAARQKALHNVTVMLEPQIAKKPETTASASITKVDTEGRDALLKNMAQLRALQEKMEVDAQQNFEKDKLRIQFQYEARSREIEQIAKKLSLGPEEVGQLRDLNLEVRNNQLEEARLKEVQRQRSEEAKQQREREREGLEQIRLLEAQLAADSVNNSETKLQAANREYLARVQLIDQLLREQKISNDKWVELSTAANAKRLESLKEAAKQGKIEAEALFREANGLGNFQTLQIKQQFEERRQNLEAYYALEIEKAQSNAQVVMSLEKQKSDMMKQLNLEQRVATSQIAQGLIQVGNAAQNQFASGMAHSFIEIAEGSKNAKEAFSDFAISFLKQIAEMILQTLILIAVRMALKSIPGIGALLASGGQSGGSSGTLAASSSGSTAHLAASGGVFGLLGPLRGPAIAAATGIALAASGVDGVAEVNGPTYMPKFNVLAGEAGKEVLTVMAKPELVDVGGRRVIMGSVQGKRLAMMSASDLLHLASPANPALAMANGGFLGDVLPASPAPSFTGPSAAPVNQKQRIEIDVNLSKDLEGRIVKNATQAAVVQVNQEVIHDSALSNSIKRLVR